MTRKDYVLIAEALKDAPGMVIDPYTHKGIAEGVRRAAVRFDRERFLKAAGVQS